MDNIDKYIDNLFEEKLSNASLPAGVGGTGSANGWMNMSKVLRKKAFLKFTVAKFNVYYLSAIVAGIFATGVAVLPELIVQEPNEAIIQIESEILPVIDSFFNESDKVLSDTLILEPDEKTQNDGLPQNKKEECIKSSAPMHTETKQDSVAHQKANKTAVIEKTNIEQVLSNDSVVLPKQEDVLVEKALVVKDTIVAVDTVKVTKKRLLLRRKK